MSSLPAERRCLGKVRVLCQERVIEAVVLSLLSERKSLNLCSHLTHIHTWIRQVMSRWALVYWTIKQLQNENATVKRVWYFLAFIFSFNLT